MTQFDKRPGLFEATRAPLIGAVGAQVDGVWRVRLIRADGEILADIDAGEAMGLSIDIAHAAGIVCTRSFEDDGEGEA